MSEERCKFTHRGKRLWLTPTELWAVWDELLAWNKSGRTLERTALARVVCESENFNQAALELMLDWHAQRKAAIC
jgi:hypothetical protein